jgi:hypothetical protein
MDYNKDDPRQLRKNADERDGHTLFEVSISNHDIEKSIEFAKEVFGKKERTKLVWFYDGCDCVPQDRGRSLPDCTEHWNRLKAKEAKA